MRVRSIAKEVFGLDTVIWNQDSADWSAPNPQVIQDNLARIATSPKTPGVMVLQHEITPPSVTAFISAFPLIATNGWRFASLAKVVNDGRTYQNALDSSSNDVTVANIISSPSSLSSSSSSTAAPTSSGSGTVGNLAPSPTSSKSASITLRLDRQRQSIFFLLFPAAMCVIAVLS